MKGLADKPVVAGEVGNRKDVTMGGHHTQYTMFRMAGSAWHYWCEHFYRHDCPRQEIAHVLVTARRRFRDIAK